MAFSRLMTAVKESPEKVLPPDEVSKAVNDVWEKLNTQAAEKLEQYKKESEEALTQAFAEKDKFHQELNLALESLEKAEIKISQLSADVTLLQESLVEERKAHAVAEAEVKNYEQSLKQLTSAKETHLSDLQRTYDQGLSDWKSRFEVLEKSHHKDMDQMKTLQENQRNDFMVKLDSLKTGKEQAEKALAKTESELKLALAKLSQNSEQLKSLDIDNKFLRQQNKEFESKERESEKTLAALYKEISLKEEHQKEFKKQWDDLKMLYKKSLEQQALNNAINEENARSRSQKYSYRAAK